MHFSTSHEDILVGHSAAHMPNLDQLLLEGHKKQKLRAHSNFYWNDAVNDWALTFNDQFDIMCESKGKNLASFTLHDTYLNKVKTNVEQTKKLVFKED
jgi:hypothetical protein